MKLDDHPTIQREVARFHKESHKEKIVITSKNQVILVSVRSPVQPFSEAL